MKKYKVGDFVQLDPKYAKNYVMRRWHASTIDNIAYITRDHGDPYDSQIKGNRNDYYECTLECYTDKRQFYSDLVTVNDDNILCKVNNLNDIYFQYGNGPQIRGHIRDGKLYSESGDQQDITSKALPPIVYRKKNRFQNIEEERSNILLDKIYNALGM